jgi:hypothetical protein
LNLLETAGYHDIEVIPVEKTVVIKSNDPIIVSLFTFHPVFHSYFPQAAAMPKDELYTKWLDFVKTDGPSEWLNGKTVRFSMVANLALCKK